MTPERRKEILDIVAKLRVTDIRDGLDWIGLHHTGTVSPDIRPLWRTKAAGFAQTFRQTPTQKTVPTMSPDDYTKWAYEYWYFQLFDYTDFGSRVGPGDFLVCDTCGTPSPAVGSMDSMIWAAKGITGCLTNGGTRDTDEALIQKALPVWSRWIVQTMYQGRVEYAGDSMPVEIGGALINPGDLIVADGDGAICVPQDVIDDVLKYAIQEAENDKKTRKLLYDRLGIPHDHSVESLFDVPPHPYPLTPDRLEYYITGNGTGPTISK